jgi:hypothetical protein
LNEKILNLNIFDIVLRSKNKEIHESDEKTKNLDKRNRRPKPKDPINLD